MSDFAFSGLASYVFLFQKADELLGVQATLWVTCDECCWATHIGLSVGVPGWWQRRGNNDFEQQVRDFEIAVAQEIQLLPVLLKLVQVIAYVIAFVSRGVEEIAHIRNSGLVAFRLVYGHQAGPHLMGS